jgi:hypothetical protein
VEGEGKAPCRFWTSHYLFGNAQEKIDELEAAGASMPSEETAAEVARLSDELAAAAARADEAEARAKTLAQEKESFGKRCATNKSFWQEFCLIESLLLWLFVPYQCDQKCVLD